MIERKVIQACSMTLSRCLKLTLFWAPSPLMQPFFSPFIGLAGSLIFWPRE